MKHTVAPWRVNDINPNTVTAPGGVIICKCTSTGLLFTEEDKANASIIAAAPELLESCNYVSYAAEGIESISGDLINEEAYQITITGAALNQLRQAIAKAKGK